MTTWEPHPDYPAPKNGDRVKVGGGGRAPGVCSMLDCGDPIMGRTLCNKHYLREKRAGRLHLYPQTRKWEARNPGPALSWMQSVLPTIETDECILWPFVIDNGYGIFRRDGKRLSATHAVLTQSGLPRPDPPGNSALHSCDNPRCVNPRHLRWGTAKDNSDDKMTRGRGNQPCGEGNGKAKLTHDSVAALRAEFLGGATKLSLSRKFGVGPTQVARIVKGESW